MIRSPGAVCSPNPLVGLLPLFKSVCLRRGRKSQLPWIADQVIPAGEREQAYQNGSQPAGNHALRERRFPAKILAQHCSQSEHFEPQSREKQRNKWQQKSLWLRVRPDKKNRTVAQEHKADRLPFLPPGVPDNSQPDRHRQHCGHRRCPLPRWPDHNGTGRSQQKEKVQFQHTEKGPYRRHTHLPLELDVIRVIGQHLIPPGLERITAGPRRGSVKKGRPRSIATTSPAAAPRRMAWR